MDSLNNKKILITGACGTVGKELITQILDVPGYLPAEVIGIDNNESQLFFLDNKYSNDQRIRFAMTDVRDLNALEAVTKDIDVIFHTAAYKHVILCERSPMEAVKTNIEGVNNVILSAIKNSVAKVIFTSSDKAVNPTNVMGTSKLMGERLMTAANSNQKNGNTIFASTRFGNILGSNGSVIPIFRNQIVNNQPVTLTSELMTRFVMSVEQAVELVIQSVDQARGGEVFITKMPSVSIKSLAKVMINGLANGNNLSSDEYPIDIIGSKPGEKLYEELMSLEETSRVIELESYFVVLPAFRGIYNNIDYSYKGILSDKVINPYNSADEKLLSETELYTFLKRWLLLEV